jgi:hypothetical protein
MRKICLALICVLLLSGCANNLSVLSKGTETTLPPPTLSYTAPVGDMDREYAASVLLYFPDITGTRMIARNEQMLLSAARHPAESVILKLLASTGTSDTLPLAQSGILALAPGSAIEITGDVATLNLAASALQLDKRSLYTACLAITNTLTQWGDIRYVNVLISGMQPGIDVAATVPMGSFQRNIGDDINTLWERAAAQKNGSAQQFSAAATLYFPAAAGKGILAEGRTISFAGHEPGQMITALLDSLSVGSVYLTGIPALPDLSALMDEPPYAEDVNQAGGRQAVLHFNDSLNEQLVNAGVPRSVMMASLTYTLTTFLPGISGVQVRIGNEAVDMVVPAGTYEGAGETILFANNLMRRSDYSKFPLSYCTLYFINSEKSLTASRRPVPYYQTQNVRYILSELMIGPQPYDSAQGLSPSLPGLIEDSDLLGTALDGNTLLFNFTSDLTGAMNGMSAEEERLAVYSIVNTMTALPYTRRVCFFIAGTQPDTFAGSIYLPGEFMNDPGIIK